MLETCYNSERTSWVVLTILYTLRDSRRPLNGCWHVSFLVASCVVLGGIWALSWGSWGAFWLQVEGLGQHFGSKMGLLGSILGGLEAILGHLGFKLGVVGPSWLQVGGSWGVLGHFGSMLGGLGAILAPRWHQELKK